MIIENQNFDPWMNLSVRIDRVKTESPGISTFDLRLNDTTAATSYDFKAGQFNMLYLPGVGEAAISMSGDPNDTNLLVHTVREAGNVTHALARLGVGDSIGLRGPFGTAWPIEECKGKDIVLIAGGIGLAPIRPIVYQILKNRTEFGEVSLLCGARTPEGLLFPSELEQWQKQIQVEKIVDRADSDWTGHVGVVTTLLGRLPIERPQQTVMMTCGPEVMMWYAIREALSRRIQEDSIWISLERNMNCAIGLCGHCQLGSEFLCKDGPVFRYDQVASLLTVESL